MTTARMVSAVFVTIGIAAGTLADQPRPNPPLTLGGYRVLSVDFHNHSSMWSDGGLTPWGLVLEARRQGLDAIAITAHNEVVDARIGQWFSRLVGGPIVMVGEEVYSPPRYHLIAAGIRERVSFRQSAASAIDEVHRQGGIAIAAHPVQAFWNGYDAAALQRLDGGEICHPLVYQSTRDQTALERFAARAPIAAIGSSDFHGLGQMGLCRTYVFATEYSERAILDAVKARRTVVFGRDEKVYGDPALVQLAAADPQLRAGEPPNTRGGWLDWVSRAAGVFGLAGLLIVGGRDDGTAVG